MSREAPGPLFEATKQGRTLEFSEDPAPSTTSYLVVDGGGLLVLFPKDGPVTLPPSPPAVEHFPPPDRDEHLRGAFAAVSSRTRASDWTSSDKPFSYLIAGLQRIAEQPDVADDVNRYLDSDPSVENAIEMLFTSVAMSARAQWRSAPVEARPVVARGWFLGRWLPTFLVLDGPVLRFLRSEAFRRQQDGGSVLRAVRSFFDTRDFMQLRHAFAHWSFSWAVENGDSVVVGATGSTETVRVTRAEADAFHIITFAAIEAIEEVFVRSRRLTHMKETAEETSNDEQES